MICKAMVLETNAFLFSHIYMAFRLAIRGNPSLLRSKRLSILLQTLLACPLIPRSSIGAVISKVSSSAGRQAQERSGRRGRECLLITFENDASHAAARSFSLCTGDASPIT